MKYTLHTAKVADWNKPGKGPFNFWQRIAIKTNGILTPANVASVVGGVLALWGLWVILDGNTVKGLALIAAGRIADIADGIIAEYTKTKSPLGESVDAAVDKLVIGAVLLVMGAIGLIPWLIVIIIALQNIVNVIISVVAKLRDKIIHPSRLGKVAAAFSWATIILYPLGEHLKEQAHTSLGSFLTGVSLVSFGIYAVMGLQASLGYGLVIYKEPARRLYRLFK